MTSQLVYAVLVGVFVFGALARRWWLHGQQPGNWRRRDGPADGADLLTAALEQLERERRVWLRATAQCQAARRAMDDVVRRSRS